LWSGSADPDHNMGLLSEEADGGTKKTPQEIYMEKSGWPKEQTAEEKVRARDSNAENRARDAFNKPKDGGTYVDPDAGGGDAGTPTEDEVAHAVAVHGGNVDVIEGFTGPQIEGDAPPRRAIDFVKDPIDQDSSVAVDTPATVAPPGEEISHTINPNDGFDPGRDPSPGPGTGGDGDGSGYSSAAATAAEAPAGAAGDTSTGVTNIGSGSNGGIQSVDVTGLVSTPTAPPAAPIAEAFDVGGIADIAVDDGLQQADAIPVPIEPVADTTAIIDTTTDDIGIDLFSGLDMPDDLAVPDEVDLDDGF